MISLLKFILSTGLTTFISTIMIIFFIPERYKEQKIKIPLFYNIEDFTILDYLGGQKSKIDNFISLKEKELLEKELEKKKYYFLENTIITLKYSGSFFQKLEYSFYDILPIVYPEKIKEINTLKKIKIIDLIDKLNNCEKKYNLYNLKLNLENSIKINIPNNNKGKNIFFDKKHNVFFLNTNINFKDFNIGDFNTVSIRDLGLIEGNIKIKDNNNQELANKLFYYNYNFGYNRASSVYQIKIPIDIKYLNIEKIKKTDLRMTLNSFVKINYMNINGENIDSKKELDNYPELCIE